MSPSMDSSDETRPLLSDTIEVESQESALDSKTQYTPLPTLQFSMLCLLRVLDPMNFSQIFPYVNEFMSNLHVTDDPSQIGFYSGLVESSFAVAQLLAIYPWGFLSDKLGRRPVVLMGVIGVALSTLLFGLSSTFAQALIARALAGLFSGNVAVIPTMLIEITDKSNQAFAFPVFGLWWPVGAIIGPLIGGTFANAATTFPEYFTLEIFKNYPYFLPGLIVASFSLVGLVFGYFFLEETRNGTPESSGKINASYGTQGPSPVVLSLQELASIPIIRALCASGASLSFISTAFDVLFVLFCYSPVESGGLAFPASHIGFALATAGAIAGLTQVLFMPTVLRHVDHAKMYHFCMKLWPYTFLALPCLNLIARRSLPSDAGYANPQIKWALWVGIALLLMMTRIAFLAYSVNMLLVKRYAPNPASMGSTTALVQFSICFSRAFSPAFASSVYALSADKPVLYGYSWVLIVTIIAFTGSTFSRNIVKESAKV